MVSNPILNVVGLTYFIFGSLSVSVKFSVTPQIHFEKKTHIKSLTASGQSPGNLSVVICNQFIHFQ